VLKTVFLEEAARLLGVSRRTVYYRIREGKLATVRTLGGSQRVLVESIAALLRQEPGGESPAMAGGVPKPRIEPRSASS
jgi:excisionase family DNA binding protein